MQDTMKYQYFKMLIIYPWLIVLLGLSYLVPHGLLDGELQPAGHDVQPPGGPPQPSPLLNVPTESTAAEE